MPPQELMNLFLHPIWNLENLKKSSSKACSIIHVFQKCLSKQLEIPFEHIQYLTYDRLYNAAAAFLDSKERVSLLSDERDISKNIAPNYLGTLLSPDEVSINNDLNFRTQVLELIAIANQKHFSCQVHQQLIPNTILDYLQSKNYKIVQTSQRRIMWKFYILIQLLSKKISDFFIKDKVKIHFTHLDTTMWSVIPGIKLQQIKPKEAISEFNPQDKINLYENIKNDFFKSLENHFLNDHEKEILLSILLRFTKLPSFNKTTHFKIIENEKNNLRANNVKVLTSQGLFYQDNFKYLFLAAKELGIRLLDIQNGGSPIFDLGNDFEQISFCLPRDYLTWAPSKKTPKSINSIKMPNPRFKKVQSLRIKKSEKFKVLYTPIALSHLYNSELFLSFLPEHISNHREGMKKAFVLSEEKISSLKVKVKAFGNCLWKDYEYLSIPILDSLNAPVTYELNGTSSQYFAHHHIHITDGLSTTFSESLSHQMPTIGIWNPDVLVCHSDFKELFDKLLKHRIIITQPEELNKVLSLYQENPSYWFTKDVQLVVQEYCSALAYHNKNWKREIKDIFI